MACKVVEQQRGNHRLAGRVEGHAERGCLTHADAGKRSIVCSLRSLLLYSLAAWLKASCRRSDFHKRRMYERHV
jgi:hypothetical protein